MLAMVLLEGLHLVAVIGIAGGVSSAYYPGILLLFLGLPVVLPITSRQASGMLLPLLGLFGSLPVLIQAPFVLRSYLTSMFFVGGSVVVSIVGSFLLDQLRFREHQRRLEVTSARDKLAVLDQAKNRFTANVHHELRTPLTLIIAPLEGILSSDYGDMPSSIERPLKVMRANAKRLLRLISDLLDLAKLESRQFTICRRRIDLCSTVNAVVERASALAERKGIDLSWTATSEVDPVNADADAVDKILTNLVGNALKFTNQEGQIDVKVSGVDDGVQIDVSDSGIGLSPSQLPRVFDRFAQVDSEKRKHEGTGIGLSLSKELVEFHGGEIWARSEGIRKGSTFSFILPRGVPDATEEDASAMTASARDVFEVPPDPPEEYSDDRSKESSSQQRDGRVLVVDDNPEMRELIRFVLAREFLVETAQDGIEALARVNEGGLDLVVTDIMMPRMSGTELCRRMKADRDLSSTPVVLVSSKASDDMRIEGLEIGADDYVTKPFHPKELVARCRSLVFLRRTQSDLAERNSELEAALSQLTLAQSKIVETERLVAVGELAAGIAHEVNNPVNYALNAARILDESVNSLCGVAATGKTESPESNGAKLLTEEFGELAEEIHDLSGIIQDGLERTATLVLSLRDLASPAQSDEHCDVDLREALESTIDLVKRDFESKGIRVRLLEYVDPVVTRGDSGSLKQLILNVLKNAAEAMDGESGDITIGVQTTPSAIEISFRDQGPGIDEVEKERIFDPFFTTKGPGSGTGLGLSICRKIASAHGGTLELEESSAGGSVFVLTLPRNVAFSPHSDRPSL